MLPFSNSTLKINTPVIGYHPVATHASIFVLFAYLYIPWRRQNLSKFWPYICPAVMECILSLGLSQAQTIGSWLSFAGQKVGTYYSDGTWLAKTYVFIWITNSAHLCKWYKSFEQKTLCLRFYRIINTNKTRLCFFGEYIFSCDQAALWMVLSVRLYVRLSVRLSVCHTCLTMFPSSYHQEIFRSYHQGLG